MKTHYSGGIVYKNGNRLIGWPVCQTGERAVLIERRGNHSQNKEDVDCKSCLRLIEAQEDYKKEYPEHWERMRQKGYCL